LLSVLTPAFNEAENLDALYDRLLAALNEVGDEWEWLIVDDHSRDATFAVIERLSRRDSRVRGIRLARNSGSHAAITCGLHHVRGDAAVMMAADLQDPPEMLAAMTQRWRQGAQIVWATRRVQPGDASHAGFAAAYYWMMRRIVGMTDMPERGADFFLVDRLVIDAVRQFPERNVSVLALLTWLGFRQETIEYDKQPRHAGRSGWTFARKAKLVADSLMSFSGAPIRLCWMAGLGLLFVALIVLIPAIAMLPSLGAGLLLVVVLMCGFTGLQLLAVGIVGEYVWRALDEARRRPLFIIEAMTPRAAEAASHTVAPFTG
jgi:polyisoprenyl-phosphate glycosyltransferase